MLHCAAAIFLSVQFFRALPWPAFWLARKPLSCHACMTVWMLIGAAALKSVGVLDVAPGDLVSGAGVCLAVLQVMDRVWGVPMTPPSGP